MNEYRDLPEREMQGEEDKIDIVELLTDVIQAVRKFWWLVILLTVFFAGKEYFNVTRTYVPQYIASATTSVSSITGSTATDMAKVFPYILTSGVLKEVVAEDLGVDAIPGSINVVADEGTNLLTISVTSADPQMAYDILVSVMENYPEVAKFVVGETMLTILDETGVPSDTGREQVFRGSYEQGAVKGFTIGMAILLLYALTRRTVKNKKDIKRKINLNDYGSIPYIRTKRRKKQTFNNVLSLRNERVSQRYVEALRKVRIKVMKKMEEEEYKTLLVTSSIPGEGKTTLAANLAISIAQQGKSVILVDCDLRHPSVASVMNEENEYPGIGAVLEKKVPLKAAMTNVDVGAGNLTVIYGKGEDEDTKLLASKRMYALIQNLKKQADIVVLDTAPSGLLADAPVLAKYVDAALYVIRYDHTKMRQIREGVQSLAMSNINIIGYVFNSDASARSGGYGGYGGYSGYGSYGSYGRYARKASGGHYGSYGRYGKHEVGTEDEYGRVMKE